MTGWRAWGVVVVLMASVSCDSPPSAGSAASAASAAPMWDPAHVAVSLDTLAGAADDIRKRAAFDAAVLEGIIKPVDARLTEQLGLKREDRSFEASMRHWEVLKVYLSLRAPERLRQGLHRVGLTRALVEQAVSALAPDVALDSVSLRDKLMTIMTRFVEHMQAGDVKVAAVDAKLVEQARSGFADLGLTSRPSDVIIKELEHIPATYPPIKLGNLFAARPEVLDLMKGSKVVPGPYTRKGYDEVKRRVMIARACLDDDWVVPNPQGEQVKKSLDRMLEDYRVAYVRAWRALLDDITVVVSADDEAVGKAHAVLAKKEWALLRIILNVDHHTVGLGCEQPQTRKCLTEGQDESIASHFIDVAMFGVPMGAYAGPNTSLVQYMAIFQSLQDGKIDRDDAQDKVVQLLDGSPAKKNRKVLDRWLLHPLGKDTAKAD